ncbi:MAG: adenylate/guanylate cyclase domain-containing protein [Acidimicrobiales bacterium]
MIVAPTPDMLADIATTVVSTLGRPEHTGITLRAGLAFGGLLARDGDYFGPPVNLAARLVTLAEPGAVLASRSLGAALSEGAFDIRGRPDQQVRGFDEPVEVCVVSGAGDSALDTA